MEDSNINLPTPQMLIKKAREETIPVSLRVKEGTVAIFDKMAKEAGVNRGAMMNTWLDYYAQNYSSSNKDNSKDIMISYLNSERFWKTISNLTSREQIYRLASNKRVELCEAYDVHALLDYYIGKDLENTFIGIMPQDEESLDYIHASNKIECDSNSYNTDLYVSFEQWPLITVLLSEYSQKYKKLFPEQVVSITPDMFEKVAQVCKQHKKPDEALAIEIKNILLDYVEKQND